MGTIVLIIAVVIEAALALYCMITKSNQRGIRSWVRIGELAAFIIFSLVAVIKWDFRWYLLAVVLLIPAIAGGVSLMRRKRDKKEFKAVPTVLKAITLWLIVAVAAMPALIFPQHKLPRVTGGYKVDTAVYTYTDNSRTEMFDKTGGNRKVTVEFWYPEATGGRYPLVVFSPGAFGIRASNTSTFTELASNGYVVCSIDHPYHSFFTVDTGGKFTMADRTFLQEVIDVNSGIYDDETKYKIEQKWLKLRTDDMNFVLDTIIGKSAENGSGKVYQLIDPAGIGLMGHSLGGAAGAKLGRDRKDVDAVINLDAGLFGEETGFADGKPVISRDVYPVPFLSIYTDAMKKLMDEITDPNIVLPEKLIPATSPDAYEVYIAGTNHMSLTDLPLVSPFLVSVINGSVKKMGGAQEADKYYVIEKMNSIVLEFFNCYLKGMGGFHSSGTY